MIGKKVIFLDTIGRSGSIFFHGLLSNNKRILHIPTFNIMYHSFGDEKINNIYFNAEKFFNNHNFIFNSKKNKIFDGTHGKQNLKYNISKKYFLSEVNRFFKKKKNIKRKDFFIFVHLFFRKFFLNVDYKEKYSFILFHNHITNIKNSISMKRDFNLKIIVLKRNPNQSWVGIRQLLIDRKQYERKINNLILINYLLQLKKNYQDLSKLKKKYKISCIVIDLIELHQKPKIIFNKLSYFCNFKFNINQLSYGYYDKGWTHNSQIRKINVKFFDNQRSKYENWQLILNEVEKIIVKKILGKDTFYKYKKKLLRKDNSIKKISVYDYLLFNFFLIKLDYFHNFLNNPIIKNKNKLNYIFLFIKNFRLKINFLYKKTIEIKSNLNSLF